MRTSSQRILCRLPALLLTACGGGGGGSAPPRPAPSDVRSRRSSGDQQLRGGGDLRVHRRRGPDQSRGKQWPVLILLERDR